MKMADAWGCSLAEIGEKVDSHEFNLWQAYYRMHGYPQDRLAYGLGYVAWTVATSMGGGKHKISDFIPDFDQKEEQKITDWKVMRDIFKGMAEQHGNEHSKGKPIPIR